MKIRNKEIMQVQNPMTYIGNELNQIIKQSDSVDIRFAFCFPEIYDIGMSYLGMKIFYLSQLNLSYKFNYFLLCLALLIDKC